MGYDGSERSTRRAVSAAKTAWRSGLRRTYRPWVPEPGMWLQFDWGEGPKIGGRRTFLFCAWLAWSRFRVFKQPHPGPGHLAVAARGCPLPQELLWRSRLPSAHAQRGTRADGARPDHRGAVRPGALVRRELP
jgi:hypothetical protein